tara:strand:- start:528 stop:1019 length:492 start_codon:yes stop_codon:yes gene_type:complete
MSKELNKRQQIAAAMLGRGYRPSQVAKELKVARETISRWKMLEKFRGAVDESHLSLINDLLVDQFQLLDQSHQVLKEALNSPEVSVLAKANLAIRYLTLSGPKSTVYSAIDDARKGAIARREKNIGVFESIVEVLDQLAGLKTSNGSLSDREYRRRAEEIVRS